MLNLLEFVYIIGLFLMLIIFPINQIMFIKLFNSLRKGESHFLESKINQYSYFDSRSQLAFKILFGLYKELQNIPARKMLDRQRRVMLLGTVIFILSAVAFFMSVLLSHVAK